jgi:uncharacterized membrane protein YhaH (DUF805 family)
MEWYIGCFRKYADFSGRARRKEYWMFFLFNVLIWAIGFCLVAVLGGGNVSGGGAFNGGLNPLAAFIYLLLVLYGLASLVPGLAVTVRRLHDTGRSGWWWFISFVPIIGGIWFLVLVLLDSTPGSNQWGPNPKEGVAAVAATP